MMSLFSSFDLIFFFKNWMTFITVMYASMSSIFLFNLYNNFIQVIIKNLSSFFYSLKFNSFNKSSNFFFLSFIFFLIFLNFFSVFPYNFPLTSQVSLVLFLSLSIWISMIFFSFLNSTSKTLYHFIPEGTPLPLTSLLFLIEVISNFIRPITLMVRLVANILAGHLLMILLSNLIFTFSYAFPFYILLNLVEVFVSLIQSYIFVTMIVLYYSEV